MLVVKKKKSVKILFPTDDTSATANREITQKKKYFTYFKWFVLIN